MKKVLLSAIIVATSLFSMAATYYVSNTGNDSYSGLTTALAWKSISKVNSASYKPGDQILFQRGDTFYGGISINQSGTSGNPITFGAYGSGSNPIITGFTTVTLWTNLGGNIWESANAVSTLPTCNMVSINGENTPMGRYPNLGTPNGGYLRYQSWTTKSITSSSLTGSPNWTGAECVTRTHLTRIDRHIVASQVGSTLNFDKAEPFYVNNYGFFFQNDPRTLDAQNEWYYNPITKKIQVYSTLQPANVRVATISNLFLSVKDNITLDGITFTGSNEAGFQRAQASALPATLNTVIRNCSFLLIGTKAVYIGKTYGVSFENNIIQYTNGSSFLISGSKDIVIRNNDFRNNGIVKGADIGGGAYSALSVASVNNCLIENNSIVNTGLNGIIFNGDSIMIRNNYVERFCTIMSDGAGITGGERPNNIIDTGNTITGNVILNGYGAVQGASKIDVPDDTFGTLANGFYTADDVTYLTISNNHIANCSYSGLFIKWVDHITVTGNTVYNCSKQMHLQDWTPGTFHRTVTNNIFVSKTESQVVAEYRTMYDATFSSIQAADKNYYCRPISDLTTIKLVTTSGVNQTLAQWQAYSGLDANSKTSPISITSESDLQFEYNATKTVKTVSLSRPMIDVKGTKYATSVTLQPYTSVVLIKDNKPAKYSSEYKSICEGESYFSWTTTGKYERTLVAKTGVDSIVTTYLTVNPKYAVTENITILNGENYNGWTKSGQYIRNLNSVSGCDSIVTTNLTVDITSIKVGETMTQTIGLKKGNNMISTYLQATNPDVSAITQTIRDSGNLIKMQNEAGNSYENWGVLGGWINNLGSIQNTEGYKIMVDSDCTIQITGQKIALPLDIPLNAGWNIISFPRTDILDAKMIIQSLIDQNKLIKVQDETGNSIEDWGIYGGWKNGISNFLPGKAYRVKVNANAILTIQESYLKSVSAPIYAGQTQYFKSLVEGNGSDHTNINLVGLSDSGLSAGDELAAFDGDLCVGALQITDQHLQEGSASLIASCSTDNLQKDGFIEGSSIQLKVWKQDSGEESDIQISIIRGSSNYLKNESIMGKLKSFTTTATSLENKTQITVFPNPSQGRFTVSFPDIPASGSHIEVFNLSGRKITSKLITGITEEIDIKGNAAGIYLVKSIIGVTEIISKLVLQ